MKQYSVFSIMPDGGRRYCKYPIGHQEYKDYTQAHQAMKDVQKILDNGGRLVYSPKGSAGINKNEYVKIEMTSNCTSELVLHVVRTHTHV